MSDLTFRQFREANIRRLARWHDSDTEQWTVSDWTNALAGEGGELLDAAEQFADEIADLACKIAIRTGRAANVGKKLRRVETGTSGVGDPAAEELRHALVNEVADVMTYGDLLLHYLDADTDRAIADKFNEVSIKQGFPDRLGVTA